MSVETPPDTPPSMPSTTVSTTTFASVEMTIIAGASDKFWRENPFGNWATALLSSSPGRSCRRSPVAAATVGDQPRSPL
ncbi:hypothetical protein QJS10_CPA05g02075 [Acorus calamus]|uniref:Uncharacterized protein n=1 Tax=Acorus calamus TaxID=4465 RepID=A0AAV9ET43_ACOCL|nr:hypothetical protein QJS10_CPA05g02075 [Acorus calamus]